MNSPAHILALLVEAVVLLGVSVYLVGLIYSSLKGAPYVPTHSRKLRSILSAVPITEGSVFIEPGSGDGRMVRLAAQIYKTKGVGIEANPLLVALSILYARWQGVSTLVSFVRADIFSYSYCTADYVYLFLMPHMITKLVPRLQKELKKGTIIISHGFKVTALENNLFHTLSDTPFSTYYYRI